MTLPASGTIAMSNFNTELGVASTTNRSMSSIYSLTKTGQQSYAMNAYYSKAYYKKTNAGNCNNGNCNFPGNCTYQCTNCTTGGAINCANCDAQSYIQTNCNCACTYNCTAVANVLYDCACLCACSTDTTCFLAGSPVFMADGSLRRIEDVKIGEYVKGAYGEANKVLAYDRPLLGNRLMFVINGEHRTTDEHSHMRADRSFGPISLRAWQSDTGTTHPVIVDECGTVEQWLLPGVEDMSTISQLQVGEELWTIHGSKKLETITSEKLPAETQLYNLVLDGSHTYFVDGYCVTGFINGYDFDHKSWSPLGEKWLPNNYRK